MIAKFQHNLLGIASYFGSKVKAYVGLVFVVLFLVSVVTPSYAGRDESRRPTAAAIERDLLNCTPLYALLGSMIVAYYANVPTTLKLAGLVTSLAGYTGIRILQEDRAEEFQDHSYVLNHSDFNNDLYNDYAKWVNLDAINNSSTKYADYLGFRNADPGNIENIELRKRNVAFCGDLVGKTITRTDQNSGFEYYDVTLTYDDIISLDGCTSCPASVEATACEGGLYGFTYELYNEKYVCDGGVRVFVDGPDAEKCIEKGRCETMSQVSGTPGYPDNYLVCSYKVDEMVCAEAVFCSYTLFDSSLSGGIDIDVDVLGDITSFLSDYTFDWSGIDGRVHHGKDYTDPGIPAITTCQNLIDDGRTDVCLCTTAQAANSECTYGSYHTCSRDNIDTVSTCEFCGDISDCVEEDGSFVANCSVDNTEVCGYYPNDEYMAHCALEKDITLPMVYLFPDFISKYCTDEAVVDTGKMSLSGRIARCVELSVQNMFFGSYEEASGGEITGIYCTNGNTSVDSRSDCDSGIFSAFQDYMYGSVKALAALAISFIGIMVLFGLMSDLKAIFSYIMTMSLVFYFALSDGWRDSYYNAIVTAGKSIALVMTSELDYESLYGVDFDDGCDFDLGTDAAGNYVATGPNDYEYPDGESHFALWDLYDCKVQNFFTAMSSGSKQKEPFSGFQFLLSELLPYGAIVAIMTIVFLFALMFVFTFFTAQFLFFSMSAFFVLTLLVFISPVVIPLVLLKTVKKARGIFDAWLKAIIGYSFQPLIVYVGISLLLVFYDYALYGDASKMFDDNNRFLNNCNTTYIPCIFHKIEIGYYTPKASSWWTAFTDQTLLMHAGLAFGKAIFFILITCMIVIQVMKTLSGSIFDASESVDIADEMKGILMKAGKASMFVGHRAGLTAWNTMKSAKSMVGRGSGRGSDYF